jgi:hypothetical protein
LTRYLRQGWETAKASPVLAVVLAFLSVIPEGNLLNQQTKPQAAFADNYPRKAQNREVQRS